MADKKKNYNQENALRMGIVAVLAMVLLIMVMQLNTTGLQRGQASKMSNTICSDSDGGQREFFVGTVGIYNSITKRLLKSYPDTCAADRKTLTEYVCNPEKTNYGKVTITCPGECSGGECKCYDSDGGRNLYVKGTTIWRGGTYIDRCYDTNRVYEFRCDNNIMFGSYDECPSPEYCRDGICVRPVCGNGIIERGEECDGANLGGSNCSRLGFFGGTLTCTRDCKYDTSRCTVCSDSDGGLSYEVRGGVRNIEGNAKTDNCGVAGFNPTNLCGDPMGSFDSTCAANALVEHYCGGNIETIKVNGVFSLGRTDCSYDSYPLDGYVYVSCGTSGTQRAPIGADGGFRLTAPWDGTTYQFYLVSLGTANSDIRSAKPIMTYKNIQCRYGCSNGACIPSPTTCGNMIKDGTEPCDGYDFGTTTCITLGFTGGGTLACTRNCTLDTSRCIQGPNYCGNGIMDPGEQCDPMMSITTRPCTDFGFANGTARCDPTTCKYTTAYCIGPIGGECGDTTTAVRNNAGFNEQCDSYARMTCSNFGFTGGTIACNNCLYDTSACTTALKVCGDGIIQAPNDENRNEQCDGNNLGNRTCADFGNFTSGTLACNAAQCVYDFRYCY